MKIKSLNSQETLNFVKGMINLAHTGIQIGINEL